MSTIFNATDKKLVVYADKEDKDLQKLKKCVSVESYERAEYGDGMNCRYVVISRSSTKNDVLRKAYTLGVEIDDLYFPGAPISLDGSITECMMLVKVSVLYKDIADVGRISEMEELYRIVSNGNQKGKYLDPLLDADYLMSVAMPKFKSTDRLNMFKKQLRLTVDRLNGECLMEPAKSLTKERADVYDYLVRIYSNYISAIKEGLTLMYL